MRDAGARVLLVDDVPGERANFVQAFGPNLTVVPSVAQLNELLHDGVRWDVAFVDFYLGSNSSTGLTAQLRLHHESPDTNIVTYSQFTENGRTLYAAAAKHWFDAEALMDKTMNDPETLVRYVTDLMTGADPTPPGWRRRLLWSHLVDDLLAEASWVQIWRAILDSAGEMARVAELLGYEVAQLRPFKDKATAAVNSFNERFHDIPNPVNTRNKKRILSSFASENRHFLMAPDLSVVMSPGTRRLNHAEPPSPSPGHRSAAASSGRFGRQP